MPETFDEFADSMRQDFLPVCYDTKVLSVRAGRANKSDLHHLFKKCTEDKKYNNNLVFEADLKSEYQEFAQFEKNVGQGHDAGFDAFMTGMVFFTLSKFIEIGNIIQKPAKQQEMSRASKR